MTNNRLKLVFVIILLSIFKKQYAQFGLSTSFGKSDVSWFTRVGFDYSINDRLILGAGSKIIFNAESIDDYIYRNNFHPQKIREHFGAYGNISFHILKEKHFVNPFIGYDFSYVKSSLKIESFDPIPDALGNPTNNYEKIRAVFSPLNTFEHFLIFGLDFDLKHNIHLIQNYGIGIAHFSGYKNSTSTNILFLSQRDDRREFYWYYFNFGLKWDIPSGKKSKKE